MNKTSRGDRGAKGVGSVPEITMGEAAKLAGVPRRTLSYAALRGHLAARKIGRQYVTSEAAVRSWLRSRAHVPTRRPKRHWRSGASVEKNVAPM